MAGSTGERVSVSHEPLNEQVARLARLQQGQHDRLSAVSGLLSRICGGELDEYETVAVAQVPIINELADTVEHPVLTNSLGETAEPAPLAGLEEMQEFSVQGRLLFLHVTSEGNHQVGGRWYKVGLQLRHTDRLYTDLDLRERKEDAIERYPAGAASAEDVTVVAGIMDELLMDKSAPANLTPDGLRIAPPVTPSQDQVVIAGLYAELGEL